MNVVNAVPSAATDRHDVVYGKRSVTTARDTEISKPVAEGTPLGYRISSTVAAFPGSTKMPVGDGAIRIGSTVGACFCTNLVGMPSVVAVDSLTVHLGVSRI